MMHSQVVACTLFLSLPLGVFHASAIDQCIFCGVECPQECWSAMKTKIVDDIWQTFNELDECQSARIGIRNACGCETGCTNTPSPWMVTNDKTCEGWRAYMGPNKCKHDAGFVASKYCQQTCFDTGNGYDGDDCTSVPSTGCNCQEAWYLQNMVRKAYAKWKERYLNLPALCDDNEASWMQKQGKTCSSQGGFISGQACTGNDCCNSALSNTCTQTCSDFGTPRAGTHCARDTTAMPALTFTDNQGNEGTTDSYMDYSIKTLGTKYCNQCGALDYNLGMTGPGYPCNETLTCQSFHSHSRCTKAGCQWSGTACSQENCKDWCKWKSQCTNRLTDCGGCPFCEETTVSADLLQRQSVPGKTDDLLALMATLNKNNDENQDRDKGHTKAQAKSWTCW